jgi:hypothetical protein
MATSVPTAIFTVGVGLFVWEHHLDRHPGRAGCKGIFGGVAKSMNKQLNKKSKGDDING